MKEVESIAITNWDAANPLQATVVVSTDDSTINWVVGLNPDGTLIWT